MSVPQTPRGTPEPAALRCPRCGAAVAAEQDWCLECGAPARTRLAATPDWRLPVAAVVLVVLLAGVALALAFSSLTADDGIVTAATATTAAADPNAAAPASIPVAASPGASSAAPSSAAPSTAAPSTATP